MEVTSRLRRTTTDFNRWTHQRSPQRTKVWIEPPPNTNNHHRRVPVVYYLSRNGHLQHPHFLEVPLSSSSDGLYLRDVIDRLNSLRGKGMAASYSWSSKRSYKNGFVWHDLAENDFIYPAHGQEYVLKGSELVEMAGAVLSSKSDGAVSSVSKKSSSLETQKSDDDFDSPVVRARRNQSLSAIDLHEYKVYAGESSAGRIAAEASTQTEASHRRRRAVIREVEELSREEISPPPSDSSSETLESLMKSDGKLIVRPETEIENPTAGNKTRAPSMLMQLITCGSISFRDCGPAAYGKQTPGFSLVSNSRSRMLPREENQMEKVAGENVVVYGENRGAKNLIQDKEYFSGSLVETKRDEFPDLKRSNSYNADR